MILQIILGILCICFLVAAIQVIREEKKLTKELKKLLDENK